MPNEGQVQHERAKQRVASKADLLERKQPRRLHLSLILDDDVADEYDLAVEALNAASNGDRESAEQRLDEVRVALDDVTVALTLQTVGARRYDELVEEHPPTKAQLEAAKKDGLAAPPWDRETFLTALIAESLIEPALSADELEQLRDRLNRTEWVELQNTALEVNTRVRRVAELGKGSG